MTFACAHLLLKIERKKFQCYSNKIENIHRMYYVVVNHNRLSK